jgi:hypothetical protein
LGVKENPPLTLFLKKIDILEKLPAFGEGAL